MELYLYASSFLFMRSLVFFLFLLVYFGSSFAQENDFEKKVDEVYSLSNSDYFLADSLIEELVQEARLNGSIDDQYLANYTAGKIAARNGFHEEAIEHFETVINRSMESGRSDWLFKTLLRLSSSQMNTGQPEKSLESCRSVFDLASEEKDTVWMVDALICIAETYRKIDRLDYSIQYNQEALVFAKTQENENYWGRIYNNLGATLGEMGKNQEAIDTLRRALQMISSENIYAQSKFTTNIAYCFRNMGEFDSAIVHNKQAMKLKRLSNEDVDLSYNEGAIGRAFQGLGQLDSAIYYTKLSLEHAKAGPDPFRVTDATVHLSHAYYEAKEYKNAFYFLNQANGLKDSLYSEELDAKIEFLQRKYDLTKKEQEIERLNSEKRIADEQSKVTFLILSSVLILLAALTLIFILIAKRRAEKNKRVAMQLEMTNQELSRNKLDLKNFTQDLMQKNQAIKKLSRDIQDKEAALANLKSSKAEELQELSDLKILTESDWTRFKVLFEKVYPGYFKRLNTGSHKFTKGEKRLMALVKLDMNNKEIADTLGISSDSVIKSRFRLKKKLELEEETGLDQFIHQI